MAQSEETIVIDFNPENPLGAVVTDIEPITEEDAVVEEVETEVEDEPEEATEEEGQVVEEVVESTEETVEEETEESAEEVEQVEESKEVSEENIYKYFGKGLLEDGMLPEDYEIKDDVSGYELYETFKSKLKDEVEDEVKQEIYSDLESKGINETDIAYARLYRSGVDPKVLSEVGRYEQLSNVNISDAEDSTLKALSESMLKDQGLSDKRIKTLIDAQEVEEEGLSDLGKEAKAYYKKKYESALSNQLKLAEKQEKLIEKQNKEATQKVKQLLSTKEIGDHKLTQREADELSKGLFKKDQILEVDGKKYKASEFQKFMQDFQSSVDTKLLMYKFWKYKGEKTTTTEDKVGEKVEREFLKKLNAKVVVDKTATKKKKVKNKLESVHKKRSSDQMIIHMGGKKN